MKQSTRAFVAAAAVVKCHHRRVAEVYDCSEGTIYPLTPFECAARIIAPESVVLSASPGERVSLEVHEDLFTGVDWLTGGFFAGTIQQSNVMLYDGDEGRYYKFEVH